MSPTPLEEDRIVWPDWYGRLWDIPGFEIPLAHAQAWLESKGISVEHAENTAYALKSKWPGPAKNPYRDVWATFQNWCKRPPLSSNNSSQPQHETVEEERERFRKDAIWLDERRERARINGLPSVSLAPTEPS